MMARPETYTVLTFVLRTSNLLQTASCCSGSLSFLPCFDILFCLVEIVRHEFSQMEYQHYKKLRRKFTVMGHIATIKWTSGASFSCPSMAVCEWGSQWVTLYPSNLLYDAFIKTFLGRLDWTAWSKFSIR